jgi:hypothetical protein
MDPTLDTLAVDPSLAQLEPVWPAKGPGSKEEPLSFCIRSAAMASQLRAAWGVYIPPGSGSMTDMATSMSLVFSGIWHTKFEDAADQSIRHLVATNVTLFLLTTGIELERLLAVPMGGYTIPGLVWGDVLFILWGDQKYRKGLHGPKLTLTARVPGRNNSAPTTLNFATISPTAVDRDTARLMFLLALKVEALPSSAMAFCDKDETAALLASSAARVDNQGRHYVVFKAKESMAKEQVFTYYTSPAKEETAQPPLASMEKVAYTIGRYELDLREAMLRKWPFTYDYQELRGIWHMGWTKDMVGFECFPKDDPNAQQMMDHTCILFRKGGGK